MKTGNIVRCRNRDWVLMPSGDAQHVSLRPLTGVADQYVELHRGLLDLLGMSVSAENLSEASFPLPTVADLADAAGARLLWQAARLTLREGASPLRSLGRISIRPRVYQFVPLLMSLRLEPVRLLIADDVGVGKTIEALLVAREMLDRGEVRRLAVLCPPNLCEQWQAELAEKFNLDSVVVRAGTIRSLESGIPRSKTAATVYGHYPIQIISIDFVKSDRNRASFLQFAPELVIVDEAHGAAQAEENSRQHQRHDLVRELAAKPGQHLILLTATPHSGIESAFRSLLGLLQPQFAEWNLDTLAEKERIELARHFVQRTRRDIERDWEGDHCFPRRESSDETYRLSPEYKALFDAAYDFCSEIVRSGHAIAKRQQRARFWGALALLRCVMSSPAAALATLESRHTAISMSEDEPSFDTFIYESSDDRTDDDQPTPPLEAAVATLQETDRKKLRDLAKLVRAITPEKDSKLADCVKHVRKLLAAEG